MSSLVRRAFPERANDQTETASVRHPGELNSDDVTDAGHKVQDHPSFVWVSDDLFRMPAAIRSCSVGRRSDRPPPAHVLAEITFFAEVPGLSIWTGQAFIATYC